MSRQARLIGDSINQYRQLVDDYHILLCQIKDGNIRKSKISAEGIEDEATRLMERYDSFGHNGINSVFKEVKNLIMNPISNQMSEGRILFQELEYSGLMCGGKYWSDWSLWYKVKSSIFQPDEKKNGPAAYTFILDGIVDELQYWRGYFASEVSSWWIPVSEGEDNQYWHSGELSQYIDKKTTGLYQNRESFVNEFIDTYTYAQFREKIFLHRSDDNPLGWRTGKEYAAISLFLVNSSKIAPFHSHDYNGWRSRLCRAFPLPDFSNYHPQNNDVKEAYNRLKGQFNFLL